MGSSLKLPVNRFIFYQNGASVIFSKTPPKQPPKYFIKSKPELLADLELLGVALDTDLGDFFLVSRVFK